MRYLLLTAALAMNMQAMLAQSSYQVKNSVTFLSVISIKT